MKPELPLLSVIVPVFNGAETLPAALNSILCQQGAACQMIVVDDGSTDNSGSVAQAFHPDICCVRQSNQGPAAARNRGLRLAQGDFISFLDADDCWPTDRVAHHMQLFTQIPGMDIVIGTTQTVCLIAGGKQTTRPILPAPLIQHHLASATYRRHVFERVGLFNPDLRIGEDKEWFQRALAAGVTMHLTPIVALEHRLREDSLTYGTVDHNYWFLAALRNHLRRRRQQNAQRTGHAHESGMSTNEPI
jgi:glycosyltransferase involved in cell wall biosynthesis